MAPEVARTRRSGARVLLRIGSRLVSGAETRVTIAIHNIRVSVVAFPPTDRPPAQLWLHCLPQRQLHRHCPSSIVLFKSCLIQKNSHLTLRAVVCNLYSAV